MKKVIVLTAVSISLCSCAGLNERVAAFDRKTSAEACVAAGYTAMHIQYEECIANTTAQRRAADQQAAQEAILGGVFLGAAINSARAAPYQQSLPSISQPTAQVNSPVSATMPKRQSTILCPNGNYVVGNGCYLAPDGTYQSAPPVLAPDGSYVSGQPRLAPDGTYVGGKGPIKLCPDGTYVAGNSCRLLPNGRYAGE